MYFNDATFFNLSLNALFFIIPNSYLGVPNVKNEKMLNFILNERIHSVDVFDNSTQSLLNSEEVSQFIGRNQLFF